MIPKCIYCGDPATHTATTYDLTRQEQTRVPICMGHALMMLPQYWRGLLVITHEQRESYARASRPVRRAPTPSRIIAAQAVPPAV